MGKPTGDQPNPQPQEPTVSEPAELVSAAADAAPPEPAKIEAATVAALPQPEPVAAVAPVATAETAPAVSPEPAPVVSPETAPAASPEPALVAAMVEAPRLESAIIAPITPQPDEIRPADVRSDETIEAAAAPSLLSGWTSSLSLARARRLAPLAATILIAAALGAMGGSLATAPGGQTASEPVAQSADARAAKEQVARLHAEIAALKTSIDSSAKSASAQLIKLGDRLDRFEKAQAEPTARLAKLAEAVDRIDRRTPNTSVAAAAHEITGSVTALAPAPHLEAPETRPASPPVLEGWRVRSVYNGAALIQARAGGIMEVEPGDNLPGIGRIEAIRRQEGKWVVVTSKGVIVAR
jgi:hypothetical protein